MQKDCVYSCVNSFSAKLKFPPVFQVPTYFLDLSGMWPCYLSYNSRDASNTNLLKNITEKYPNFKSVVTFVLIVPFAQFFFAEKIISWTSQHHHQRIYALLARYLDSTFMRWWHQRVKDSQYRRKSDVHSKNKKLWLFRTQFCSPFIKIGDVIVIFR